MLRPSRPLTVWLLWLAIALLPMRAWAASTMTVAMVAEAAAVIATVEAGSINSNAGPCHQGNEESAGATSSHSCGLCGVCHSAVVSLPNIASALPALPSTSPPSDPDPGVERAVLSGPDRPPRIVLA